MAGTWIVPATSLQRPCREQVLEGRPARRIPASSGRTWKGLRWSATVLAPTIQPIRAGGRCCPVLDARRVPEFPTTVFHVLSHLPRGDIAYHAVLGKTAGRLGRLGVRLDLCYGLFGSISVRVTSPYTILLSRVCESPDSPSTSGLATSYCGIYLLASITSVVCFVTLRVSFW